MLQIEKFTAPFGHQLISAGESLNDISSKNADIFSRPFRILSRISYLEIAIGTGSLLLWNEVPKEMRGISYLGVIGIVQYLAMLAISDLVNEPLKISTRVLPFVGRAFHSVGNRLAA